MALKPAYLREIGRETTAHRNRQCWSSEAYLREIGRETTAAGRVEPLSVPAYLREIGRETTAKLDDDVAAWAAYLREIGRETRLGRLLGAVVAEPTSGKSVGKPRPRWRRWHVAPKAYLREIGRETTAGGSLTRGIGEAYLREIGRETTGRWIISLTTTCKPTSGKSVGKPRPLVPPGSGSPQPTSGKSVRKPRRPSRGCAASG